MQSEYTSSDPRLEGLSTSERRIVGALMASEATTVSVESVLRAQPMSRRTANQLLSRLHRKGWLQRQKRGLYTIVPLQSRTPHPPLESAWPLAMRLFEPCCISGWSAAEHWDLTEQIFNEVCVVTGHPQPRGTQEFAGTRFRTKSTSPDRIFGTTKLWFGSQAVEIADPHRLLIDILDTPELGGGGRHALDIVRAYWSSPHRDPEKLLTYAKRYARGAVFKRLGFSAELYGAVDAAWLEECRSHMTTGVSRFDPAGARDGRILSRWNLKLNLPVPAR